MFKKCAVGIFSLLIFMPGSTALAHEDGASQNFENRFDYKEDQINQHLDQKSDRIENRLERKGNKMDRKLDRKSQKAHRKMHKKGQKIDRKMHNTGFQHGMSQALNNGKGKKKGLHRKMR